MLCIDCFGFALQAIVSSSTEADTGLYTSLRTCIQQLNNTNGEARAKKVITTDLTKQEAKFSDDFRNNQLIIVELHRKRAKFLLVSYAHSTHEVIIIKERQKLNSRIFLPKIASNYYIKNMKHYS